MELAWACFPLRRENRVGLVGGRGLCSNMAAVESSSSEDNEETSSLSHPLLEEMKGNNRTDMTRFKYLTLYQGLLSRLKMVGRKIQDGCPHLVPFCETIESVFRHGLKRKPTNQGIHLCILAFL